MENQKIKYVFENVSGNKSMVTIEGDTIKFGGQKFSLAKLEDLLTQEEPSRVSKALNSVVYGLAQVTAEAINNNAVVQGLLPTSTEIYYAKLLAESFAELEVK
ncbi:hypothetical protein [uncultured Draconibacterium sp.]|uniref:hypothetical protein n=1 Tax=uncultured Draconibacterium sp. TaxID=1573823 RepID=UPI0025DAACB3|nr:hypothetical protein [uncultured Draconibacterium sp.]